jgi:hypothetical protein
VTSFKIIILKEKETEDHSMVEGFCFVLSVTGLNKPNTGKMMKLMIIVCGPLRME